MSFEPPVTDPVTTPEVVTDQLTFNVGDRTFNAESATTKIEHAEAHIAKIEAENAAFKLQVDQSTSIDEALKQLREQNATPQNVQAVEQTSPVSAEQIGEIANKQIAEYLANKQVEDNALAAQSLAETTSTQTGEALTKIYGDKTGEAMVAKATELGITTQALYDMAKNPATAQLLLQTMKVTAAPSQPSPTSGYTHGTLQEPSEKYIDYAAGKVTSSTILAALDSAKAKYSN